MIVSGLGSGGFTSHVAACLAVDVLVVHPTREPAVDQGMDEQGCPSGLGRLERFWQLQVSRDHSSHLAYTLQAYY